MLPGFFQGGNKTISREATKTSFFRRMDGHTVVHPDNEALFSAEKTRASKPERTGRSLTCVLLSERSQSDTAAYCAV